MGLKIRAAQTNKKLSTAEALLQLVTLERVSKTSPPLFKALRSKSRTSPQNAQHRRIFGDPGSCAPVFGTEELLCFLCVYRGLKPASARLKSCPDTNLFLKHALFPTSYSENYVTGKVAGYFG